MKIEGLLSERYIVLNLDLATKSQVIDAMLSMVQGHREVNNPDLLHEDVWTREKEMSTGIGKNIALPHAKTSAVNAPVLAIATLRNEINYDSIDREPVRMVFLLATPEEMLAEHLKLLGRITRIAGKDEVRQKILQALTPLEVLELFRQEEKDLPHI
jgi:PTS system fructose-specific IIA component/PTS system nitrogen regulatory IIA component